MAGMGTLGLPPLFCAAFAGGLLLPGRSSLVRQTVILSRGWAAVPHKHRLPLWSRVCLERDDDAFPSPKL